MHVSVGAALNASDTVLRGNTALQHGGGGVWAGGAAALTRCLVERNSALINSGGGVAPWSCIRSWAPTVDALNATAVSISERIVFMIYSRPCAGYG